MAPLKWTTFVWLLGEARHGKADPEGVGSAKMGLSHTRLNFRDGSGHFGYFSNFSSSTFSWLSHSTGVRMRYMRWNLCSIKWMQEPYHDPDTVTDELVDVLLSPLLTEGECDAFACPQHQNYEGNAAILCDSSHPGQITLQNQWVWNTSRQVVLGEVISTPRNLWSQQVLLLWSSTHYHTPLDHFQSSSLSTLMLDWLDDFSVLYLGISKFDPRKSQPLLEQSWWTIELWSWGAQRFICSLPKENLRAWNRFHINLWISGSRWTLFGLLPSVAFPILSLSFPNEVNWMWASGFVVTQVASRSRFGEVPRVGRWAARSAWQVEGMDAWVTKNHWADTWYQVISSDIKWYQVISSDIKWCQVISSDVDLVFLGHGPGCTSNSGASLGIPAGLTCDFLKVAWSDFTWFQRLNDLNGNCFIVAFLQIQKSEIFRSSMSPGCERKSSKANLPGLFGREGPLDPARSCASAGSVSACPTGWSTARTGAPGAFGDWAPCWLMISSGAVTIHYTLGIIIHELGIPSSMMNWGNPCGLLYLL